MGEEFNTEQFIQNLWERENLQGLKQVNGKGGYRNGRYFPYQGTNGIDIGPGFLLKSQSPAFQKKAKTVGLTKKELDDSVRKSIRESMAVFNNRIKKEGGNPNALSNNVLMGLLDMNWQLGKDKFMNQYNNFWKAVANGDYEGMRKESRTTWKDNKGQHIDTSRWNFRKNNYFQDPEPLVPVVNNPTYIAQPDALKVSRPLVPPAVPSRTIMPNIHAEGGMLYGNQEAMSNVPNEESDTQDNAKESPKQWDDLSLSEKNAFIANAVQHGITNMEDIRNAYNELMQEQLNGNDSMDDMEDSHKFLKGGYKPSRYIKNFISHMEGASMKTNRSFEAEAKDFWNALPNNVKGKITQEQADALYSYSYNVGAGNFKNRVVPALERYFSGKDSVEDVQRHMYATKDNQLRGLANRRAQERAMFAGSEVPVYYNEDYTPQSTNSQWRNNRLGPVTAKSFNISQGLGPVSNTSNTLGPVTSSDYMAQRNKENTEALANILYGSQPMTAFDAPQETIQETSSIDRYNEIQDLLSTPYTFANGGEKDSSVTSTNGLYHAYPSEYAGILDSVANNNPLEVTLPDTTVTTSDPSNYRSYYDPNGFMDFANIVTLGTLNRGSVSQDLGLIKDTYDAVRGKKSWKDVGLSAIMGNKGVFNNPYANLALDFAVPVGIAGASKAAKLIAPKYDLFRPIREFNVTKPQFEGIINSEKESSAIAPNINSLLLSEDITNKIAAYANSQKDPLVQIKKRMNDPQYAGLIKDNSDRSLSSQEGVKYFEGIDFRDPSTYAKALEKTRNWWNSHTTPYSDLPMSDAIEQEIALNHLPFAAAPSPYVYMPNARNLYYEIPLFSRYPKDINEMMHQYNILKGHETAHIITTPKNNSPLAKGLIPGNYFSKINGTEVSARGTQFKNYFDKNELTADDLKYASEHYVKDTGIDNEITTFFNEVKRQAKSNPSIWQELAKWMSVTSPAIASPIIFNKNNQ